MIKAGFTLIFMGACMGIGFWASKKMTNKVDELLARRDPMFRDLMKRAANGQTKEQAACGVAGVVSAMGAETH